MVLADHIKVYRWGAISFYKGTDFLYSVPSRVFINNHPHSDTKLLLSESSSSEVDYDTIIIDSDVVSTINTYNTTVAFVGDRNVLIDAILSGVDGGGNGGSGGNLGIPVVNNYNVLPAPNTVAGEFYWTENSVGYPYITSIFGGDYYPKGLYFSDGVSWEWRKSPQQSTLAQVNAGTNDNTFVSPKTFNDADKWNTKAETDHEHVKADITDFDDNDYLKDGDDNSRLNNDSGYLVKGEDNHIEIFNSTNAVVINGSTHGFGRIPDVSIYKSNGDRIHTGYNVDQTTFTVTITFNVVLSGKVLLT